MKKFRSLSLLLVVAMTFMMVGPAFAFAGIPNMCSGVQLQNTSATNTPVTLEFYTIGGNTGTPAFSYSLPGGLDGGKGVNWYFATNAAFTTLPDGMYSVVVTSQQLLNSLVSERSCSDTDPYVQASDSGVNAANTGTKVFLGFVASRAFGRNGSVPGNWSSIIAVQNAGTAATATGALTAGFFKSGQSVAVETKTFPGNLQPGETWLIDLSQGADATVALNSFSGAVVVNSDQPVAVVSDMGPNDLSFGVARVLSYNGVPEATATSQTLYAPQVWKQAHGNAYTSGIQLYNPNGTATPVTISWIDPAHTLASPNGTTHVNIPANAFFGEYLGDDVNIPVGFDGTAVIKVDSGANKVLGVVTARSNANGTSQSAAMNMIRDEDAATTLFIPSTFKNYNPTTFNFVGGWLVYNTTATDLILDVTYTSNSGVTTTDVVNLPASKPSNSAAGNLGNVAAVTAPFIGGLTIHVRGDAGKIVGIANIVATLKAGDTQSMYNPFTP